MGSWVGAVRQKDQAMIRSFLPLHPLGRGESLEMELIIINNVYKMKPPEEWGSESF